MTNQENARPFLGATPASGGQWNFVVWAPQHEHVTVHVSDVPSGVFSMSRNAFGYHSLSVKGLKPGAKYVYNLGHSLERPDPASRFQAQGVHGPSQLIDLHDFPWSDSNWKGIPLQESIFYELHVGTFTREGTFAAIIPLLDSLVDLGITTVELMPIAQFSGTRNWGYDGVYPYAVQNSYGTPRDLQQFVDAAHARGLAVALDVVYNHLGPEGNYLRDFAPYFTDHYKTPWGAAINFDGPLSDEVRHFFIQNAVYWLESFHIDALRLDAIHGIFDASAVPFLADLSCAVNALASRLSRNISLIAESDLNDSRVLRRTAEGGFGMDCQWSDDFHHAIHTLLTGEHTGYYADFGQLSQLKGTLQQGWYYDGKYSRHRRRRHGNTPPPFKGSQYLVCTQNHDQVGNRALGERLSCLTNFEGLKLAAAANLLSPFVPLLFMGEEYGETAPFRYFVSHGDPGLIEAVRRGRAEEFRAFQWRGEIPDPQAESTFAASRLKHELADQEPHRTLRRFYQALLQLRRKHDLGRAGQPAVTEFTSAQSLLVLHQPNSNIALFMNFGTVASSFTAPLPAGTWSKALDSAELEWLGPGTDAPSTLGGGSLYRLTLSSHSCAVFERAALSE